MYIARGASSKLPGYVSPSDHKFFYCYAGVDLYYGEDYQILTCKIPGAYLWRPLQPGDDQILYHKEVFVDDTNRFTIAQFYCPINFINTKEIHKVAYFKDPILGFLKYKRNPSSPLLSTAVAYCMGKSCDIDNITLWSINEKISYLSVHTVSLPRHIHPLSQTSHSVTQWTLLATLKPRIPESASIFSHKGNVYVTSSSNASENIVIIFFHQRKQLSRSFPPGTRYWIGACKILGADDPDAFQWKCFAERDMLHNTDSGDRNINWSIEKITDFCKNIIHPSHYNVLVAETSEEAKISTMITNPYTLQDLCRNVILVSTLGIPNSIDSLPLPISIKEYCKRLIY